MTSRTHLATSSLLFALLFAAGALPATTYVPVSDRHLVEHADLVVRAEVAGRQVVQAAGPIMTEYHVDLLDLLKGETAGSRLVVRVPGGFLEDRGLGFFVLGAPELAVGQRALLFLRRQRDGSYRIAHMMLGVFLEQEHGGRRIFTRHLGSVVSRLEVDGVDGAVDDSELVRDGESFESWVRARVDGADPPADYFRPRNTAGTLVPRFTVLRFLDFDGDGQPDFTRWFEFDEGERVTWHRHRAGMEGLSRGRTRRIFKDALTAWNQATGPVRLRSGPWTRSTTGFTAFDGRNTILFDDRNGLFGSDFDCFTGGTLGAGTIWVAIIGNGKMEWKGEMYFPAVEAEIIINDNTSCVLSDPEIAAEVFTHEVGHTLGLGHSCGDRRQPGAPRASPKCRAGTTVDDATMRAAAHFDGRANELRQEDLFGVRYLYDPDFDAGWCRNRRPGTNSFCRRCGPCGEGQGGCGNDSHCAGELVCVADAGEEFGYSATTDVCLPPG